MYIYNMQLTIYLFRTRFCEAQMVSVATPFTLWNFFHLCSNLNLSWLTQIHITYTIKCLKTYCLYIFVDIICEKFKKTSSKLKCCFLRESFWEYSIVWSINLNFMKHKLVYCAFLKSASNTHSVGINKNEITTEYQINYSILHKRYCETWLIFS